MTYANVDDLVFSMLRDGVCDEASTQPFSLFEEQKPRARLRNGEVGGLCWNRREIDSSVWSNRLTTVSP